MSGKIDPLFANHPDILAQQKQTQDFIEGLKRDERLAPPPLDSVRGPTAEDIYACAQSTLIGFRDELTEQNIKFICDQISRKAMLSHNGTRKER